MDRKRMTTSTEGPLIPCFAPSPPMDGYLMLDQAHPHHHHEENWGLEKLCTEDFLVDDLLDLGGIASDLEDQHEEEEEEEEEEEQEEDIHSSTTSALSNQSPLLDDQPLCVPEGDISDLEWVSRFVDDSLPVVVPFLYPVEKPQEQQQELHFVANPTTAPTATHSRTPSSASVTSISSSPAVSACFTLKRTFARFSSEALLVPCKTRTKRSRRVWSLSRPELADPLCSSSSSSSTSSPSCSSTSSSSCLVYEPHAMSPEVLPLECSVVQRGRGRPPLHKKQQQVQPEGKKKKGRKPMAEAGEGGGVGVGGRRCSHCGVQKTPQWRTGPMGAKTLCNACGVRYKSGRLLPEYRPACSPTFVSHVHSNSHRKVLELRRQNELLRLAASQLSSELM